MARIHRDRHGLYVKAGGYLFRPQISNHPYISPLKESVDTRYQEGDQVPARHLSAALGMGRVGEEHWYNHGPYMGTGAPVTPEDLFDPRQ